MIERQIVASNVKERRIQEYISHTLRNLGHSHCKLQKTPLGEKIIIYASRPGLIVGRKGQNIKKLTTELKQNFDLENPQIEIQEVPNINLDAQIVAERVASSLEKFGTQRFKGIGHNVMSDVMASGAFGVEILISGKIPSSRAKRWRFYQGYLKKCGDIALTGVRKAYSAAQLKTGTVGIIVRIMPPETVLPDRIEILEEPQIVIQELSGKEAREAQKEEGLLSKTAENTSAEEQAAEKKSKPRKKAIAKKSTKQEAPQESNKDSSLSEVESRASPAPQETTSLQEQQKKG